MEEMEENHAKAYGAWTNRILNGDSTITPVFFRDSQPV